MGSRRVIKSISGISPASLLLLGINERMEPVLSKAGLSN